MTTPYFLIVYHSWFCCNLFSNNIGPVTFGDIITILPFGGTDDVFDLEGRYLLEALESSVADYGDQSLSGRFLQFSGETHIYYFKYLSCLVYGATSYFIAT